jgi:cyclase|tara:strand:+ start:330 stop:1097 length:768 start_codon:yes stop_codon:yes gene_type:complete
MRNIRLIPRLDIKGENLIKGIQLEGLRIVGDPSKFAKKYYDLGADEILYMDSVASLYGRNNLSSLIKKTTKDVFIPITVGGGIRSVKDAYDIFISGADKIAVNTAAVKNPQLIFDLVEKFGSQSIVISIEAKKIDNNNWEVFTECGREKTGIKVIDWVKKSVELGAGEILLTSVDREGMLNGYDLDLIKIVSNEIQIPLIASGGMSEAADILTAVTAGADAISMASVIHYNKVSLEEIRKVALENNIDVREFNNE